MVNITKINFLFFRYSQEEPLEEGAEEQKEETCDDSVVEVEVPPKTFECVNVSDDEGEPQQPGQLLVCIILLYIHIKIMYIYFG